MARAESDSDDLPVRVVPSARSDRRSSRLPDLRTHRSKTFRFSPDVFYPFSGFLSFDCRYRFILLPLVTEYSPWNETRSEGVEKLVLSFIFPGGDHPADLFSNSRRRNLSYPQAAARGHDYRGLLRHDHVCCFPLLPAFRTSRLDFAGPSPNQCRKKRERELIYEYR